MKMMSRKIVESFTYQSKDEQKFHKEIMRNNGWKIEAVGHMKHSFYNSYSKEMAEGMEILN